VPHTIYSFLIHFSDTNFRKENILYHKPVKEYPHYKIFQNHNLLFIFTGLQLPRSAGSSTVGHEPFF
jgi:hypothetical protein